SIHDVHHYTAARNDLVVIPLVYLDVATQRLLVADICDEAIALARQRLRYLASIRQDSLHSVFGVPLACVCSGHFAIREPTAGLWSGHHNLQVIRRQTCRLRSRPLYASDAAVLNAATTPLLDLHLQLQVEVACFVAAIDDVIVALWLALERLSH